MQIIEFVPLLSMVQEHISSRYAAALTDTSKLPQLKSYIEKFIRDGGYEVKDLTQAQLCQKLYTEMAEYSILTKYLGKPDIEEININAWNDIAITYTSGKTRKAKEHFYSPSHAVDIVKRLLHHSGMIIDNSTPMSQGHLPNNTRITALKEPIVDDDIGVSVSIRLLHPSRVNKAKIIKSGNATEKMVDFLCMCIVNQSTIGGDSVTARFSKAQTFYLFCGTGNGTAGGYNHCMSKVSCFLDGCHIIGADIFGI